MTASDARFWAEQAAGAERTADPAKTRVALTQWHKAIEAAAKAGRRSVAEADVEKVRTPISPAARQAALNQLTADGFTVTVAAGAATVSW